MISKLGSIVTVVNQVLADGIRVVIELDTSEGPVTVDERINPGTDGSFTHVLATFPEGLSASSAQIEVYDLEAAGPMFVQFMNMENQEVRTAGPFTNRRSDVWQRLAVWLGMGFRPGVERVT